MSNEQIKLPRTQFSGLNIENIITDVQNLVRENPEYNKNWDDFLNSNAGRILVELFAYIADQLAVRIDWNVNENFISTATQKSSIIKLLKLIAYKFELPNASEVLVKISNNITTNNVVTLLPEYIDGSGEVFPKTLTARDRNGIIRSYEAIEKNAKFEYKTPIEINLNSSERNIKFYEGKTYTYNYISTTDSGEKIILPQSPVIRDSIRIYKVITENNFTTESELLKVDNFLEPKAQLSEDTIGENAIPFVVNTLEDNQAEIEFGSSIILPQDNRRLPIGTKLIIFYRVGGGLNGNLNSQAINTTEVRTIGGNDITFTYINEAEGVGGEDAETIEEARYRGPLSIKTGQKAATDEDYNALLTDGPNILLAKAYGQKNMPSTYFDKYGEFINPLDVIIFAIFKTSGWEEFPTNKYNISNWGTLNLENVFNNKHYFQKGNYNNQLKLKDNNLIKAEEIDYNNNDIVTFKNFKIIETPQEFKDVVVIDNGDGTFSGNPKVRASITKTEFDKSIHNKIKEITDHIVNNVDDPFFYGNYNETDLPRDIITEDINAYIKSKVNIKSGIQNVDSSGKGLFILNIDGHGDVNVDLSQSDAYTDITAAQARDFINAAIIDSGHYDGLSYQDMGILIEDTSAPIENLELQDEEFWKIRITNVNYDINTGTAQKTYSQLLTDINNVINGAGYTAEFVQNRVNITCWDIRIKRTSDTNSVILEDSNTPRDLLEALGALPLSTSPVAGGDYDNIATIVDADGNVIADPDVDSGTEHYLKLTSPNVGSASFIEFKPAAIEERTCLNKLFSILDTEESICLGQRRLIVITNDTDDENFGNFIYEHGTVYWDENNNIDPYFAYLNYIEDVNDKIQIGTYFHDNFNTNDPEYRSLVDSTIYNTQYKNDPENPGTLLEVVDEENSDWQYKLTKYSTEEMKDSDDTLVNDLKQITNDIIPVLSSAPNISTIDVSELSSTDLDDTTLILNLDESEVDITISFSNGIGDNATSIASEINTAAGSIIATVDSNIITISSTDNKNGKIIIRGNISANEILFAEITSGNSNLDYTVYCSGDYYLEYNDYDTDTKVLELKVNNNPNNVFPDYEFFVHYIADRRHIFKDSETEKNKINTNEDFLQNYLYPFTFTGVTNVVKRPVFDTFDIKYTLYYYKNFSEISVKTKIENALRNKYSIAKAGLGKTIRKSDVVKIIMDFDEVRYVEIEYFGRDSTDVSTNKENNITSEFDEILVLSDDIKNDVGAIIHGLISIYVPI
ncbi:MAG: hypothetical protein ACOC1O_00865 [bacterium]